MRLRHVVPVLAAFAVAVLAAAPAAAVCQPFICYLDLTQSSTPAGLRAICPNSAVYDVQIDPVVNTAFNPLCDTNPSTGPWAAVVTVDLPADCSALEVIVEYDGVPEGWTVNVGDSASNDGFGGDADSAPIGQNAELQILDDQLGVWAAIDDPPAYTLATEELALRNGALKMAIGNQELTWSQPFTRLQSVDERLFHLPASGDRTLYAAFNRVVSPAGAANSSRNGCGASHVLMFTK